VSLSLLTAQVKPWVQELSLNLKGAEELGSGVMPNLWSLSVFSDFSILSMRWMLWFLRGGVSRNTRWNFIFPKADGLHVMILSLCKMM